MLRNSEISNGCDILCLKGNQKDAEEAQQDSHKPHKLSLKKALER